MVSYDVTSFFTKHTFRRNNKFKLFQFAISQTNFLFNGNMYDQVDGIAMGSPLAPILVNILIGYHEKGWKRNHNMKVVLL